MEPDIYRVQGFLVATHSREVAVKLRRDRESKAQSCKADDDKGIPYLMGDNLTYLLPLGQVSYHEEIPPIWKELEGGPNCQHLTTLQREINDYFPPQHTCAYCLDSSTTKSYPGPRLSPVS